MAVNGHYGVHPALPPASLFNFSPSQNPAPISPPIRERSLAHPFNIPPQVYHDALSVVWPIVIGSVYAVTVTYLNKVNAKRDYKPWAFSRSSAFFLLVVAHNIFLALYSAWTFAGMATAFRKSWPGLKAAGTAGIADSLCKIHGPRGLGSAATYVGKTGSWGITDYAMKLTGGLPDTTDVGRIWNEGLAYYGWIFYLSKFYEVVDTAIILTKGKKTSLLQTYHHTGAMFAMWAGIRYMSPPIWLFTTINSFIHMWMYSYYTAVAFGFRVHPLMKRSLTGAQIFQIVFGASYAFLHLFVAYDSPTYAPFKISKGLSTALPGAYDAVSSAVDSPLGEFRNVLKKAALRAAGQEGLAANVRNADGNIFGEDAIHAADSARAQEGLVYKLTTSRLHCLDTSGEVFAIVLNLLYLVPLAYLFISFFGQYFDKSRKGDLQHTKDSASRAARDVAGEIADAIGDQQGGATQAPPNFENDIKNAKADAQASFSNLKGKASVKTEEISGKVKEDLERLNSKAKQTVKNAKQSSNKFPSSEHHGDGAGSEVKVEGIDKSGEAAKPGPDVGDPDAFEVNPDVLLTKQEKQAEKKLQNGT